MPAPHQQQSSLLLGPGAAAQPGAEAAKAAKARAEASAQPGAAGAAMPVPAAAPSTGAPDMQTLGSSDMRASGLSCGTLATNLGGSRVLLPVAQAPWPELVDDAARCPSVRSGLRCLAEVAMDVDVAEPEAAARDATMAASGGQQQEREEPRPPSPWQVELAKQAQQAKQAHDGAAQQQRRQQQQEVKEAHKLPSIRMLLCAATAAAHAGREPELQALLRTLVSEVDRRLLRPEDDVQRDALLRLKHAAQERLCHGGAPADGGLAAGEVAQAPQHSAAPQQAEQAKPARSEEEGFGFELSLALPVPLMAQQQAHQQAQQQAQHPPQQADPQLEFPRPHHEPPTLEFPRLPRLRLPFAAALMQAAARFPQLQAAAAAAAAAVSEPAGLNPVQPWSPAQHSPAGLAQQLPQPRPLTPAESHGSAINRFGPAAGDDASPHTCDSATGNAAFGAFVPAPAALQHHVAAPIRPRPVPPQAFSALAELAAAAHPERGAVPRRLATARLEVQRLRAAHASPWPLAVGL